MLHDTCGLHLLTNKIILRVNVGLYTRVPNGFTFEQNYLLFNVFYLYVFFIRISPTGNFTVALDHLKERTHHALSSALQNTQISVDCTHLIRRLVI